MTGERLGDRIERLRRAKGLTQAGLAELAGVLRETLCRLECNRIGNPEMVTMECVAGALRIPLSALLFNPLEYADALTGEEQDRLALLLAGGDAALAMILRVEMV